MGKGYIKIYRDIEEHWIFQNDKYLKAWITIIMTVNHEDKKVLIGQKLFLCKRGQSLKSVQSWAKKFGKGWSIQRVKTLFKLLKNDGMIELEGMQKSTRLTVCNYETYQSGQPATNQQVTNSQLTANHKQYISNTSINTLKNMYIPISEVWNLIGFKKCRKITDKHERAINGIMSDKFTEDEIKNSITLYGKIVNSPKTYYTHKFTFLDFLTQSNGCRRFIQATFEEYLNKFNKNDQEQQTEMDMKEEYGF